MEKLDKRFDRRMTVLINEENWQSLRKIANKRKLTNSDLVREAIYQFLGKQGEN